MGRKEWPTKLEDVNWVTQLLSPCDFYTFTPSKHSTSGTFSYNDQVTAMYHRYMVLYKWFGQMAECTLRAEAS